jgi:hypothetical protein
MAADTSSYQRGVDLPRIVALMVSLAILGLALLRIDRMAAERAFAAGAAPAAGDTLIYDGGLAKGWQDWSWAKRDVVCREQLFHDRPTLRMEPNGFQGVYLHADKVDTTGATSLWVWVHGGVSGGQKINVAAVDANKKFLPPVELGKSTTAGRIPAGRWSLAILPLTRLRANNTTITGFVFQDAAGMRQPPIYLAGIVLKGAASRPAQPAKPAGPITISIDATKDVKPISPFIYGLAGGTEAMRRDQRISVVRWGGNANTRYNWERGNCWNAARDWYFRNGNYGSKTVEDRMASGVADRFVTKAKANGSAAFITIPTIGWVARDDNQGNHSVVVPAGGGVPVAPGSEAIAGYDPAANRRSTSVRSFAHKRSAFEYPPDLRDDAVYQDEWVAHLVQKFGRASNGGVRFYAMDNEPDLWRQLTRTSIPSCRTTTRFCRGSSSTRRL